MNVGIAFLIFLWVGSHLAIVFTIRDSKFRLPVFAVIGLSLLGAYGMKPYTYDLENYSVFFNTGFIETYGWYSPGGRFQNFQDSVEFQLDVRDTTGEPFTQGFEPGFRLVAKVGNMLLPAGNLVPRFDPDVGDFEIRGPPRFDAMIFLFMVFGFVALYIAAKQFVRTTGNYKNDELLRFITSGPLIIGSIFFLLGSQNSLRQFLGVSIIVVALSMLASRRYAICVVFLLLAAAFHRWAPIFGLFGVTVMLLDRLSNGNHSGLQMLSFPIVWGTKLRKFINRGLIEKAFTRIFAIGKFIPLPVKVICVLSPGEMLSLMLGITTVILIKGLAVLGIFNYEIPLIGDLKPFLIMGDQFDSMERLSSLFKAGAVFAVFACSEILLGKTTISDSQNIRSLRRMIFVFVIPFVFYSEIFSRILFLYWGVELIFVMWGLSSREERTRLAAATIFIAYGFAPNAINVLVGPNWLRSF